MDKDQAVGSAKRINGAVKQLFGKAGGGAKLEGATTLAFLALFLGMIMIWAQVIIKL